ncbi:MAG: NAD(P)-dependent oxidoreductase [Aquabacterium sp.]|nr:NAD(P)-dependent oxidoreductase [Aquabacterium sp.]
MTPLCATPVAVVGIGNMGLGMALRLRDAGQPLWVHDADPARHVLAAAAGAVPADSPAAAAAGCAVLIVAVVDAAQTEAVLFGQGGQPGAAATLAPGASVLLCPTMGPADVERLAARLAQAGLACLDAPMSGGPLRARDGSMSLMVAGASTTWQALQPLLRHLASRLFFISQRPGDGARTKLVNNLLAASHLAAAAEAMALAQRLGLDGAATLAVVNASSGHSWIGADRMARALDGDFAPRAHTTLLAKDSALALAMAAQAGVRPLLGTAAAAQFQAALAAGYGGDDDARLLSLAQLQFVQQCAVPDGPAGPAASQRAGSDAASPGEPG